MRKLFLAVTVMVMGASILVAPAAWAAGSTSTIPVGSNPNSVAFSPNGTTAYVANYGNSTVSVIDVATGTVTSTIPVGVGSPHSVAFSPNGTTAYVTKYGYGFSAAGEVSVIDVATATVTGTIPVGGGPVSVAFSPNGATAYVANHFDDTVSVVDVAIATVTSTIQVGVHPTSVAFTPNGTTAYVTNEDNTVSIINVATGTVMSTVPVGAYPFSVAFSPNGTTAYVANANYFASADGNTVSVIDVATATVTNTIPVGANPASVVFSPNGSTAYVSNNGDNTVSVIDVTAATVTGTIPVGGNPSSVAFSPNGTTVYVANSQDNTVSVISGVAPVLTGSTPPVGAVGVAYSYRFTASGLPSLPTFVVSSGVLPAGLTLSRGGVLSGTPTGVGSSTFTVTASNGVLPNAVTASRTVSVLAGPVFADVVDPTFAFYPAIGWMFTSGISTGTAQPSGLPLYKPANSVSRQAMAAFMLRLSGQSFTAPVTPTFADVDSTNPFYQAVEWMAAQGISTGTPQPSGKPLYKPADAVSRQAMALFLARYAHANLTVAPTVQSFADVPVDAAAAAAVKWMKDNGISTGTIQPSGLPFYKPADPVSRQAMAAFLYRLAHLPTP
jgi:YVTN family beta-propeller protein